MSSNLALIITFSVIGADLLLILSLLVLRMVRAVATRKRIQTEEILLGQLGEGTLTLDKLHPKQLLKLYTRYASSVVLQEAQELQIQAYLVSTSLVASKIKHLRSPLALRRIEAIALLKRLAKHEKVNLALLEALKQEKSQV
ncbi:MAG: hypothetical protein EOM01_11690, partial [Spirochaetia bacterium]|nr:hypothetical protein [Spirochaetia bacterium]